MTYLLISLILTIAVSCSQKNSNKNIEDIEANNINLQSTQATINPIKQKEAVSVSQPNLTPDTSSIYHACVSGNIGSIVNYSIDEIAPLTTNVPQQKSSFNISQDYEIQFIEKKPTILTVIFDNDIFDNTDYYYTNGINIELATPFAQLSPLTKLLAGLYGSQVNLYGFSIKQNIYTPVNPDISEISIGDRPFSAFLTIGQFRESYNIQKNISVKSSINIGILGPASLGGLVQSSIHDIEPVGWSNQINNNIVFDYSLKLEKGIISTPHFELNLTAGGNLGTVFNKLNTGLYFRTGSFIPVYKGPGESTFQYWFFVKGETNIVLYDATLQGGMFNNNTPYTIKSKDINRLVAKISVGIAFYYKKVGIELQNFYLSPEFKNAYDFRWGRIKLVSQF